MNFSGDLGVIFSHIDSVKQKSQIPNRIFMFAAIIGLSACSSVKMPDLVDLPEFSEAVEGAENLDYPDPAKAPDMPDDMRKAESWDKAANALIRKRDNFNAPVDIDGLKTDAEIEQEIQALKSKVKEYKLDDPVE